MMTMLTQHPGADELRAYTQGYLSPEAADSLEQHFATCEECCRLLAKIPGDSFESRLREAQQEAPFATTAAGTTGTLAEAPEVPPQLQEHPRYRVLGLVGQGGMGAVYRAEHRHMERLVALKVINPGLIRNPATVQRFRQEVRAAARLHHANIVTAHDADEAGGLHFLVMEYVDGRSLADLLRERGPLPVHEACEYVRQAALGLQHAHEQGMVHRDVKPHNLMLTPGGVVQILDFGLARLARTPDAEASGCGAADASLTGVGTVMGSADYIAPEQAADPRTADIRADIYALGCTLFHLLAGRPPFPEGTVQEKLACHAKEPLPPLPELPPGLAAVVARMTAKDPAARFATPAEVAKALAPFAGIALARRRRTHKRRLIEVGVLLLAGLIAVAGIVLRLRTDRGEIVVQTDDPTLELSVRKNGKIIRIRDPHSRQTWDVDTKHYQIADADKPGGLVMELPGRGTITLRRRGGGRVTVTTSPKVVQSPVEGDAFQPLFNGKNLEGWKGESVWKWEKDALVARTSASAPVKLAVLTSERSFNDFELRFQAKLDESIAYLVIRKLDSGPGKAPAAQGVQIALLSGTVKPLGGGKVFHPRKAVELEPDAFTDVTIKCVGQHLTVAIRGQTVFDGIVSEAALAGRLEWLVPINMSKVFFRDLRIREIVGHIPTAEELARRPNAADALKPADVPEAARAYVGGGNPKKAPPELVAVLGDVHFRCPVPHADPTFSPDGKMLALLGLRGGFLCDGRTGRLLRPLEKLRAWADGWRAVFSPDGRYLAGWHPGGKAFLWETASGRQVRTLAIEHTDAVAFSPDGKHIAVCGPGGNSTVFLFDVKTSKRVGGWERKGGLTDQALDAAFWPAHPNGPVLAILNRLGRIELWKNVIGGKPLLWRNVMGFALAFSPDGKYLAACTSTVKWGVQLYDTEGKVVGQLDELTPDKVEKTAVGPMAFTPDGKALVLVKTPLQKWEPFIIKRWDVASRREAPRVSVPSSGWESRFALSPDGGTLAVLPSAPPERVLRLFNTTTGKLNLSEPGHTRPVRALTFSPDGKWLASADEDKTVRLWDLAHGREVTSWVVQDVTWLSFGPDSETIIAGDRRGARVFGRDGKRVRAIQEAHGAVVTAFALSPDGRLLATGSADKTVRVTRLADGREARIFGHRERVGSLAFSPDGRLLAATAAGFPVKFWDVTTGEEVQSWHPKSVLSCIAFTPDGQSLLALEMSATEIRVVDWRTGTVRERRPVSPLPGVADSYGGRFGPDGRLLALCDKGLLVLTQPGGTDPPRRAFRLSYDENERITATAFSGDGRYFAAGTPDGTICVLRLAERGKVPELAARAAPNAEELAERPNAADALKHEEVPEAARAYVGSGDPRKAPLELVAVLGETRFRCSASDETRALAFSSDGKLLAVPGGGVIRLFGSDGGLLRRLKLHRNAGPVRGLTFSPNGKYLAAWDGTTGIYLWDTTGAEPIRRFRAITLPGAVAFSPDSKHLALCALWSNIVRLYEVPTGKPAGGWASPQLVQARAAAFWPAHSSGWVLAIATEGGIELWKDVTAAKAVFVRHLPVGFSITFSKDGKYLAACTGTVQGGVRLYDRDGKDAGRLATTDVGPMAFTPDGKELVILGFSEEKPNRYTLGRWDLGSKKEVFRKPLEVPNSSTYCGALSPDGRRVALRAFKPEETVVRLFDTATGRPFVPEPGHARSITALAFSPDGKLLASSSADGTTRLWDLAVGREIRRWDDGVNGRVSTLVFSPDGKTLAVIRGQGNVELRWVAEKWQQPVVGHTRRVWTLAFSPDGKYLATGSEDNTIRLWSVANHKVSRVLPQTPAPRWLLFTPDGRHLLAAGWGAEAKLWNTATGDEELTVECDPKFWGTAFRPGGKTIEGYTSDPFGGPGGSARSETWGAGVWNLETGKTSTVPGPKSVVTGFLTGTMSPSGTLSVVSDAAGPLLLWQKEPDRRQVFTLFGAGNPATALAISPDGRYVAAGSSDGTICLLRLAERGTVPEIPPAK